MSISSEKFHSWQSITSLREKKRMDFMKDVWKMKGAKAVDFNKIASPDIPDVSEPVLMTCLEDVLLSSFMGSPRNDAMTVVRVLCNPDLFITITS